MKEKIMTSLVFTKSLFTTGAISETSRRTEIEICKYLPKGKNKVVVEFGMGHGNITKEILDSIDPTSKVYAFEIKKSFCDYVEKTIDDKRLIVINDGAESLNEHVTGEVHAVIGSIPYSFFSREKQFEIIKGAYDKLANNTHYSQVLYSKFNFKKFKLIFNHCYIKKIKTLPIEYVYHCKKELN